MKRKKRWIALAALLLLLSGAAVYSVRSQAEPEEEYVYKEETASFGTLSQGITENGSVELNTTTQDFELNLEDEDEEDDDDEDSEEKYLRIEEVYLAAGQRITEETPVIKLTEKSITDVRRKLSSLLAEAEIALAEARSDYEAGVLSAEQTLDSSLLAGANAERIYQLTTEQLQKKLEETAAKAGVLELEIKQLEQELEDGWDDFADLKEVYEDAEYAFDRVDESTITKYITLRDEWLQAKEAYEKERDSRLEQREQMREKQSEIVEIQSETEKLQARLDRQELDARQSCETDTMSGSLAEEIYSYSVESLQEAVSTAQADCEEAQENLAAFEAFVGDGIVYAAGGGLVTTVNVEEDDSLKNEGTLFSYVEEDQYVVSVDVSEEDIPNVQVGDTVNIVFAAYEDEIYSGTVAEIAAEPSSGYSATVSYPVTVQIEGDTSRLFGGMTGDVTFVTEQAEDVLYVSRKAVIEENNKCYVYTQDGDGTRKLTEVQTGFSDGISIEITEGLTEGQVIYVRSRAAAEGTAAGRKGENIGNE